MLFILASESPRRKDLLRRILPDFEVCSAGVDEWKSSDDLRLLPLKNAEKKAAAVADRFPAALVLGADTVVLADGRVLGKPRDLVEAAEMLKSLSGRTHEVMTALSLICRETGFRRSWSEVAYVRFKPFGADVVAEYLRSVRVLDKAGAYAIQEHGDWLVDSFDGELENIIGLPLKILRRRLMEAGERCIGEEKK